MVSATGRDGTLVVSLDGDEAGLLRGLTEEMRALLEAEIPRSDPVVGRIFPQAYEDKAEQESYESVLGDQLKNAKRDALRTVIGALGADGPVEAELNQEEASAWLGVVTDMRLAIGTRLQVDEDMMARDVDPDDPDAMAMSVLHWLGWLQEAMIAGLEGRSTGGM